MFVEYKAKFDLILLQVIYSGKIPEATVVIFTSSSIKQSERPKSEGLGPYLNESVHSQLLFLTLEASCHSPSLSLKVILPFDLGLLSKIKENGI